MLVIVHLNLILFNMICLHGCVSDGFGIGIVTPVGKDILGDVCSADNHRPIS